MQKIGKCSYYQRKCKICGRGDIISRLVQRYRARGIMYAQVSPKQKNNYKDLKERSLKPMTKYLAFDLEIAFDFSHISTDLFPPDDGEQVLLVKDIINEDNEKEETWLEAQYVGNIIKRFRLPDGELVNATHWKYQGNDWERFRPLGITCAAAASSDGGLWNWWAQDYRGKFTSSMSSEQCFHMVSYLAGLVDDGYTILTWNGLSFDFDILAEESGCQETCRRLALNHIDMMFHFFCSKGYPLGLDAGSKGMGLPGKPEGMDGAKAPELWPTDPHRVMSYCSLDVKNTLGLADAVEGAGHLNWTARSERPNSWSCKKWLTVKEAMALPEPDTSWMSDPMNRKSFYEWTGFEPEPKFLDFDPSGTIQHDPDEGNWLSGPDEIF